MSRRKPNTPKNPEPKTRDVNAAQRAQQAMKLRCQRLSWDEIAQQAGYASRGAAHNAVMREMNRSIAKDVEELRTEELVMLDSLHTEAYKMATDTNNAYRTFAMDRVLAISKRRSEITGMDKGVGKGDIFNAAQVVVREVPAGYLEGPKE